MVSSKSGRKIAVGRALQRQASYSSSSPEIHVRKTFSLAQFIRNEHLAFNRNTTKMHTTSQKNMCRTEGLPANVPQVLNTIFINFPPKFCIQKTANNLFIGKNYEYTRKYLHKSFSPPNFQSV
jgi:hypothetical protein